jgi:hypothetical protein
MVAAPQTAPYGRYRIRESLPLLFVTGGIANRLDLGLDQMVSHSRISAQRIGTGIFRQQYLTAVCCVYEKANAGSGDQRHQISA